MAVRPESSMCVDMQAVVSAQGKCLYPGMPHTSHQRMFSFRVFSTSLLYIDRRVELVARVGVFASGWSQLAGWCLQPRKE